MDLLCGSAGGGPEQILSLLSKVGRSGSEQILARFSEIWRSGSEKIQPPFSKIWRLRIGVRMSALLPRRPKEQRQRADPSQIGGMERSMTTWKSAFRAAVAASRLIGNSAMVTPPHHPLAAGAYALKYAVVVSARARVSHAGHEYSMPPTAIGQAATLQPTPTSGRRDLAALARH